MAPTARMRFQKIVQREDRPIVTVDRDSIVFDKSLTPLARVIVKADIRAASPLEKQKEPVTGELERRAAHTLRRRHRDMMKAQEKAEKAKMRAAKAAANYKDTLVQGNDEEDDSSSSSDTSSSSLSSFSDDD